MKTERKKLYFSDDELLDLKRAVIDLLNEQEKFTNFYVIGADAIENFDDDMARLATVVKKIEEELRNRALKS